MPNVAESVTTKIGPLPAWQWAAVIGGSILAVKVLRGGRAGASVGGGTVTTVGGGSTADDGGVFDGPDSIITKMQADLASSTTQIAGLSTHLSTLTDFQALQTKLNGFLNSRTTILSSINKNLTLINTAYDARRKCTTTKCRSTQDAIISKAKTQNTTYNTQLTTLNKQIADLQTAIQKVGT